MKGIIVKALAVQLTIYLKLLKNDTLNLLEKRKKKKRAFELLILDANC